MIIATSPCTNSKLETSSSYSTLLANTITLAITQIVHTKIRIAKIIYPTVVMTYSPPPKIAGRSACSTFLIVQSRDHT